MSVRRVGARLAALVRGERLDQELEDDIRAHLELAEQDGIASGLSPEEARRAARLCFGGIDQVKEDHRDRRSFRMIETLARDFRYGLASLARERGFTAVVVGVLALGIGANVAMFSLVDAVLLKPLPFPGPDRIVRVWEAPRPGATNSTSTPDFLDWRRLGTVFEALAAEIPLSAALTGEGEPLRVAGKAVTAEYFQVFAVPARLGRTFTSEDDEPGAAPVVVLSHSAWQAYFGGDPGVLGRRTVLDGEAHQIVGVLPPGAFDRDRAQFYKPLVFTPDQQARDWHWLSVIGRLREGVTLEQARAKMQAVDAALEEVTPLWKHHWTIVVEPLERLVAGGNLRRSISVTFGAVALVLLIACANVANMLLAKGAARTKEMAVRAALGAGRGRLAAQLLTESLALCLMGGAAGVALAWVLLRAAAPFLAQSLPYTADVRLDVRVFAFAATVALGVGLLVGALPAVRLSFGDLSRALNQSARGSSGAHGRLRRAIVAGEVALSLALVCGALLLFRSLLNLQRLETGVRIENIITVSVALPEHTYPTPGSAALFYESAAERLRAAPGIAQAAFSTFLPLEWIFNGEGLRMAGADEPVNVRLKRVDPGYFRALGIPVLAGRGVTARDRAGAPRVVVVNEALAARLREAGGIENPLGQRATLSCPSYVKRGGEMVEVEIVGVIRSERVAAPGRPDPPVAYVPLAQAPNPEVKLIVRTHAEPSSVMPAIREAMREIDPALPLGEVATMRQVRERTLSGVSRPAWVIGVFAAVAALLAALGLYGVLAHAVVERRREIGIRMALGAQPADVVSHVLRSAFALVTVGLALGLAGAFALTRVVKSLLFGVSPLDPLAMAAACAGMAVIGMLAAFLPASRAARLDPMTTLRDEG